uniref:Protein VP3 n=1 Tax=Rotavirus A TaxID=28875 RepID=A0A6M3QX23_9REOV|nr:VP3 [Rotavirus A]
MKVLALRHSVAHTYADTQTYTHDYTKDEYENAFLISNLTTQNILYYNYSNSTLEILNKSGIASIEILNDDELILMIGCNFTYDYENNIAYLHDYTYYTLNEIRTDQYWLTKTDIENYLLPGWRLTYVGHLGIKTRGHYKCSFICQNAATDDDIIIEYINSMQLDFQSFLLAKIKERMTSALPIGRLSNRIFRSKILDKILLHQKIHNIGPRNESMFTYLNFPKIRHYSNGAYLVKDTIKLRQEKWLGQKRSQFDIGQYKNMLNVLTLIYTYYEIYSARPLVYMLGSAPSWWINDIKSYADIKFETWDTLETPYSDLHHRELFFIEDVQKLNSNSVLYIDIRTDRMSMSWEKWREVVEAETKNNLEIAYAYLRKNGNRLCCVKMTAMDIELPINAKLLHFPTTEIRSEFYLLLTKKDVDDVKRYIPKGVLYSYINHVTTDNVFLQKQFKIKSVKNDYILALYSLSNEVNDKEKVLDLLVKQECALITLRLNNTFTDECKINFSVNNDSVFDWTYLPTDIKADKVIITSYNGCIGLYGLSISLNFKPTGNNHLFIIKGSKKFYALDEYANHMGISRRSHQIRFSEAATAYSGYIFRDLTNGNYNLIDTNKENSVSGHVYNALIYFRYNYSFDLKRWIYLHANNNVKIKGGKYYEHAPIELLYACNAASQFAKSQNDKTAERYTKEINEYINIVYNITYADDPTHYIGIVFTKIPYKYTIDDPHLTFGVMKISENLETDVTDIIEIFKKDLFNMDLYTSYTYQLTESAYVANVNGALPTYFKLYNMFYKKSITFGQSRMFIPHITLSYDRSKSVRIDRFKLQIKYIYLKRIHGETIQTYYE